MFLHNTACRYAANSVIVGRYTRKGKGNHEEERIPIEEKIIHPMYKSYDYGNDIMLLKLTEESIHPYIKISQQSSFDEGQLFNVIGFGDTNPEMAVTSISYDLMDVEVEYVDQSKCREMYFFGNIDDDMMCASKPDQFVFFW